MKRAFYNDDLSRELDDVKWYRIWLWTCAFVILAACTGYGVLWFCNWLADRLVGL